MLNHLNIALNNYLHNQEQELANNEDELHKLYAKHNDNINEMLSSLQGLSDILYWFGVDEDSCNKDLQKINPSTLISVSILLKNNLDLLNLEMTAKESISNMLYRIHKN
ncbi:hypothetical protein [Pasteurella atlantica]|uniref:hypothetical protein n=1 Tax=Pasteurellaceae TaxID=712 RepID=UPI002749890C|nr:hypothetical protein [Pasteurella atlantica]MDP8098537.1 hypothetical protein [Pasteurella atlantica]MDP8106771.1 hypothetical protein [Pasteurella atlantica]MDP8116462.1 hypothetical protein [Pasteurella atlantica]